MRFTTTAISFAIAAGVMADGHHRDFHDIFPNRSIGFMPLQVVNTPQADAPAPLTFLDVNSTMPDMFGVSGFTMEDQNGTLFC